MWNKSSLLRELRRCIITLTHVWERLQREPVFESHVHTCQSHCAQSSEAT